MRRRQFLAGSVGLATAGTAGCGGDDGASEWVTYATATPRLVVGQWTPGVENETAPFVGRLVDNGSLTVTERNRSEGVAAGDFLDEQVRYDGVVYEFERETTSTRTTRTYRITVFYNYEHDGPASISQDPDPNESVAYDALPAVDREALGDAFPIPNETHESMRESGVTPGLPGETDKAYSTEVTARYGDAERATSTLVDPAATSVEYNDTVYEVLVEPVEERPVVIYRYSVAERWRVDEFGARLVAEHAVPETAFTEAERAVLAEVTERGGYPVTDDEAAQSLLETMAEYPDAAMTPRDTDPVATPIFRYPWRESDWLVRFREHNYGIKHFEKTSD